MTLKTIIGYSIMTSLATTISMVEFISGKNKENNILMNTNKWILKKCDNEFKL